MMTVFFGLACSSEPAPADVELVGWEEEPVVTI